MLPDIKIKNLTGHGLNVTGAATSEGVTLTVLDGLQRPSSAALAAGSSELEERAHELRAKAAEYDVEADDDESPYQSPQDRAAELRSRAADLDRVVVWLDGLRS